MINVVNYPIAFFICALIVLLLSTRAGVVLTRRKGDLDDRALQDFDIIMTATSTLLGLIIGFSFSMAISRYDQRKNLEEEEANAIGTEYLRVELLPAADAAKAKQLLIHYLDERIRFYITNESELRQINAETARTQSELWSTVRTPASAQPTPVAATVITGMNDVLNSQGYTQAAWWNRIPGQAWGLMGLMAICANIQAGYRIRTKNRYLLLALPVILSIAFFLIADIDSPRRGIVRVRPVNLVSLSDSLRQP
jgi:hypothetical protein